MGGLSVYAGSSPTPGEAMRLWDHGGEGDKGGDVEERRASEGSYGGGAIGIVPGKYRGTNGAGPCMGGPSSDAFV